ncbi:MAG: glycosyltransferase family 4 protein [Candidatus Moranbacteria bacterium]|nr:glycosyltransferase family 4 protein [Candidatus Moranbacteria bacterium]
MRISEFNTYTIRSKSVLIVEPNPYHGELLPGFSKYFHDLGYSVDIAIRSEVQEEGPFSAILENVPTIFHGTSGEISDLLRSERMQEYEFIFFSTNVLWEAGIFVGSYLSYLGFVPRAKYGLLSVEHNLDFLHQDGGEYHLRQGRVFTLSTERFGNQDTLMLNPHYFGVVDEKKTSRRKFAVVGGVSAESKNINLLFSAVERLLREGLTDFDVIIMGAGHLEVPDSLKKHITFLGRRSFGELYGLMSESDYLLPLLDSAKAEHKKYLHGTTSGIVQLSLGFHIPMVIDEIYADRYGFDERNCVSYPSEKLFQGMLAAMQMSHDRRVEMRNQVLLKAGDLYSISLNNLKTAIRQLKDTPMIGSIIDDATMEVLQLRKMCEEKGEMCEEQKRILKDQINILNRSKFFKLRSKYISAKRIALYPTQWIKLRFQKNRVHAMKVFRFANDVARILFSRFHAIIFLRKFGNPSANRGRANIVVQLESFDKGGLEEVVVNLVRGLAREYNVYVFVVGDHLGYLGSNLIAEKITVLNLSQNKYLLKKLLAKLDIQVVNLHYSVFGVDVYKRAGVKMVYTIHNNYIWADEAFVRSRKEVYSKIDRFIAVSGQVRDYFCHKFRVKNDFVTVVNNGVDLKLLETLRDDVSRAEFGLTENDFVYINVASFNWNKFHILMVAAMRQLVGDYPQFKMLFVGNILDERCYSYIVTKIEEYGLQDSIRVIPYAPKAKVLALMRMSNCFVFPSLTEGWGIATTEAMYCEIPIIVSDVGGARDLVQDSDVGIVIPNPYQDILEVNPEVFSRKYTNDENLENLEYLSRAMEDMYVNRDQWREFARRGKNKIQEQFNVDSMIRRYQEVLNGLIRKRRV